MRLTQGIANLTHGKGNRQRYKGITLIDGRNGSCGSSYVCGDVVEMMAERGLQRAHTTIIRWVQAIDVSPV